jgi:hypothetical protein
MKKYIAALSIAALALTTTVAFAHDNNNDHDADHEGVEVHEGLEAHGTVEASFQGEGLHLGILKHFDQNRFVLIGTIASVGSNSVTVNVQNSVNANVTNGQGTVATNSSTKVTAKGDEDNNLTLASLKAGDRVVVSGSVSGSVLTAIRIRVFGNKKNEQPNKAFGSVTAKTADSITVTNSLTGVSQTFMTNGDTKVNINGEVKTLADVQVGDRGWVKFKTEVSALIAKFIALFR